MRPHLTVEQRRLVLRLKARGLRGRGGGSDVVVPARRPGRRTRATSRTVSPSVLDAAMTRNY